MKRSIVCEEFMKHNNVNTCSIVDEQESHFSYSGCDCCGISGCDVYDCHGYSPNNNEIYELGEVCSGCICWFYNGDDSEVA